MPRICTICTHRDREAVERAMLDGESYRHIAARFDTSTGALQRHRADHLPPSLAKAHAAQEVIRADALIDDVRSGGDRAEKLYDHAETILERALESKDLKTALGAISAAVSVMREGRGYLELRGRISGELKPPGPAGWPPTFGPNIGPIQVMMMPKSPEGEMLECMRLTGYGQAMGLTAQQQGEEARRLLANGVHPTLAYFEDLVSRMNLPAISPPAIIPGLPDLPPRLPHASELHAAAETKNDSNVADRIPGMGS